MSDQSPPQTEPTMLGTDGQPMLADTRSLPDKIPVAQPEAPETRQEPEPIKDLVEVKPKYLVVGDEKYPCVEKLPALVHADMLKQFREIASSAEAIQAAQATGKLNADDAAKSLDLMVAMVDLIDDIVLDEYLTPLHKRLRSKRDPVGYGDLLTELMRLFTAYSGMPLGKLLRS